MMKLLVGGDSFAQFPSHWYKCTQTDSTQIYPSSTRGEGFTVVYDYPHWAEIVTAKYNGTSKSVGIGAGDISTTVAVTVQELLKGEYTHCIFSVTHFSRDCVQIAGNSALDKHFRADAITMSEFYNNEIVDEHIGRTYHGSNYLLTGAHWFHSTDEIKGPAKDKIDLYFDCHSDFKYIQDRIANLAYLQLICDQRNIKLVFSCPFYGANFAESGADVFEADIFTFNDVVDQDQACTTEFYKWAISHYNKEQHTAIAKKFNTLYPAWGETND